MVEELLPAVVALMAEVNVNKRIAFRLDGFLDKCHTGMFGGLAAFFHVAFRAGTNHIFPNRFAAHTPGDNVVEGQLAGRIPLAAILTFISVASEKISAIKFHLVSRQAVIK